MKINNNPKSIHLPTSRIQSLLELSNLISVEIKNFIFYHEAFTHKSFRNENNDIYSDNERLEFLGDSILGLIISKYVYNKFPNYPEGKLSKLKAKIVSGENLAKISERLGLSRFLLLGKGEKLNGGEYNKSILENLFEALIAAIFLDSGIEVVENFILNNIQESLKNQDENFKDYQSRLQEYIQKKNNTLPIYSVLSQEGLEHDKLYKIKVEIKNIGEAIGIGSSKQKAKQMAAKNLLKVIYKN